MSDAPPKHIPFISKLPRLSILDYERHVAARSATWILILVVAAAWLFVSHR